MAPNLHKLGRIAYRATAAFSAKDENHQDKYENMNQIKKCRDAGSPQSPYKSSAPMLTCSIS